MLAEACRRRVVGGPDPQVMTAHVLGVEVLVERRGQHEPPELLHRPRRAVDELVGDDEAAVSRVDADQEEADERVGREEAVERHHPDEEGHGRDLEREEHIETARVAPARLVRPGALCDA